MKGRINPASVVGTGRKGPVRAQKSARKGITAQEVDMDLHQATKGLTGIPSAIVLAAGKSERLGTPKGLLMYRPGITFIEKLVREYKAAGVSRIVLVTSNSLLAELAKQGSSWSKDPNVLTVVNLHPEEGRFSSIKAGIEALQTGAAVFIQNVDNPFSEASLLKRMMKSLQNQHYVAPTFGNLRGHPVLLSASIVDHIRSMPGVEGNLKELLKAYGCNEIDAMDRHIHANINTMKEYKKWFSDETVQ